MRRLKIIEHISLDGAPAQALDVVSTTSTPSSVTVTRHRVRGPVPTTPAP